MMRTIICAVWLALAAGPALAQSTPPPLPGDADGTMRTIGRTVFSAVEKAAIEKFFGRTATPTEQVLIDAAKDTVFGADTTTASGSADDNATYASGNSDDSSGGKGKNKNKAKGQGKNKGKGLPPGLAKKDHLPPGLQKQLERNGWLPPGLAKRDLPDDLTAQLPLPQAGTERIIAGNDVVLVEAATNVVLHDVVSGVLK